MTNDTTYVIAGASLAGAKAAETLREEGFDGRRIVIGAENERPYERPPLSKDYLLGKAGRDTLYVHPPQWYAEHDVELRLGVAVTSIDPAAHELSLADGSRVDYTKLLLATGSSPRRLSVPGEADAIIVGVGITPSSQLAAAAGLDVDNGIRVDAQLRSSDPDIYAAGDVANAFHPTLGQHIRVEHWANALHQPQAAAKAMLGQDVAYDRVPYFFTDGSERAPRSANVTGITRRPVTFTASQATQP